MRSVIKESAYYWLLNGHSFCDPRSDKPSPVSHMHSRGLTKSILASSLHLHDRLYSLYPAPTFLFAIFK